MQTEVKWMLPSWTWAHWDRNRRNILRKLHSDRNSALYHDESAPFGK